MRCVRLYTGDIPRSQAVAVRSKCGVVAYIVEMSPLMLLLLVNLDDFTNVSSLYSYMI